MRKEGCTNGQKDVQGKQTDITKQIDAFGSFANVTICERKRRQYCQQVKCFPFLRGTGGVQRSVSARVDWETVWA